MSDLRSREREEVAAARDALYPPLHNPTHVDAIDVARWGAFDAGYLAALAAREEPQGEIDDREWVLSPTAVGVIVSHRRADGKFVTGMGDGERESVVVVPKPRAAAREEPQCPCGEPAPEGSAPCTFEKPCPYGMGFPRERWTLEER